MLRARAPAAKPLFPTFAYARPSDDVTDGTWTTQAGATTLYAVLDEVSADDGDYVRSKGLTTGQTDTMEIALSSLSTPGQAGFHSVSYRLRSVANSYTMSVTVGLYQGSTLIASWSHGASASFGTFTQSLSSSQIAAISNYGDLRLRFTASAA